MNMEQNVERKFNSRQNQVRHYTLEFTVNEGRAFNLEEDKAGVLQELSMTEQEYWDCIRGIRRTGLCKNCEWRSGRLCAEHAREILENMIIPQMEEDRHGVEVAGMMFFFDNAYMLVEGSDIAARLQKLSEKTGVLLMACDRCCYQRDIADKLIAPAGIGCFPNVYAALAPAGVDQVITL